MENGGGGGEISVCVFADKFGPVCNVGSDLLLLICIFAASRLST